MNPVSERHPPANKGTRTKLLAVAATCCAAGGCWGGGCPLDHSELTAMDPKVSCLQVKGNDPNSSQCVLAAMDITNNCQEVLRFAQGETVGGGKLAFAPGESGRYDLTREMEIAPNQWQTTGTLGAQMIGFTLKTYEP
jgi:hypothetical protein